MADYNSAYTGAQIDANLAKAATAVQPAGLATVATSGAYTDLTGKPTLGTAAATASTDYATAAQGTLAASAVQPADDAAGLGSGAATDGYVLTADGAGGAAWEAGGGGSSVTDYLRTRLGTVQDVFNMADTWNASGTTFTGIKLNVTDTASAAGSLLMDLQVGGVSQFSVNKSTGISFRLGAKAVTFNNDYGLQLSTGSSLAFSIGTAAYAIMTSAGWSVNTLCFGISTGSVTLLQQDGSTLHTLAQRNGVNAQAFNLYQSYTDASNYTRGKVSAASGIVTVAGESAGTGAIDIDIALTPKGTGRVRYGTHAAIAAETVTGYIEIKDAGGTVRKIAVVS